MTPHQEAARDRLLSLTRLSRARREVSGGLSFDAREVLKVHALSIAERRDHAEMYPDVLASRVKIAGPFHGPLMARTDVTVWTSDEMTERHQSGRDPVRLRDIERAADAWLRLNDPAQGHDLIAVEDHRRATVRALLRGKPDDVPNVPRLLRLDVIDKWTRQPTTAPDRVAFRGVSRKRTALPVRYRTASPCYVDSPDALIASASLGIAPRTLVEYRTDRVGYTFAWFGHRKVETGAAVREARRAGKRRAQTAIRRTGATGKRGVAVNAWNLSDRSLPRAWARADAGQHAAAIELVSILTTLSLDVVTELGEGFTVQTDGASAWLIGEHGPSRTYPLQNFARRAALAREAIA